MFVYKRNYYFGTILGTTTTSIIIPQKTSIWVFCEWQQQTTRDIIIIIMIELKGELSERGHNSGSLLAQNFYKGCPAPIEEGAQKSFFNTVFLEDLVRKNSIHHNLIRIIAALLELLLNTRSPSFQDLSSLAKKKKCISWLETKNCLVIGAGFICFIFCSRTKVSTALLFSSWVEFSCQAASQSVGRLVKLAQNSPE